MQKQLNVSSLTVQIQSQCRCSTASSAPLKNRKVQYSTYTVHVVAAYCTLRCAGFLLFPIYVPRVSDIHSYQMSLSYCQQALLHLCPVYVILSDIFVLCRCYFLSVYCYQPALNSDDVINMNLTLSVLLALCVSRLFFFIGTVHCTFGFCSWHSVYAFLCGAVSCVSI